MKKLVLGMICCALIVGVGAYAQDDAAQQRGARRGGRSMMAGGQRVMGAVEAVDASSLKVKDEEGNIWTVDVTENTRVLKQREPAKFADIAKGQAVMVAGKVEPGTKEIHAMFVSMLSSEQAQRMAAMADRMKENLGKTFLMGRITKIDETKLTIKRPDGVEQVAAVDENTSIRKGGRMRPPMGEGAAPATAAAPSQGEPITLADVKVGDGVNGPGEVKDGVFLFKELHVGGGRRGDGPPPPAPVAPAEQ